MDVVWAPIDQGHLEKVDYLVRVQAKFLKDASNFSM